MKKNGIVAVGIMTVFACLLLCTPALADYNFDGFSVETRASGTVYGGVFIGYEPWTSTTTLTGNFEVPDGEIKWARLYTGVWGGTREKTGWVNATFNDVYDRNGLGPIHLRGEDDTNPNVWCSGCGKYWVWYDVTNLTNAGQINTAKTRRINGSIDGRIYGIVLVVVYEGGDNPKDVQYWINDGSDALHYSSWVCPECGERNEGTTYFNGTVNTDIVTKANLTVVHLTGYSPVCSNCLKFNEHEPNTSMVESNDFELNSWDVTGYVNLSGNNAWYSRGEDEFVNVANTILVLEREAVGKPDLNVTKITINPCETRGEDIVRVCVNESNNISAVVYNNGTANAGAFDVCFDADGVKIGCVEVAGLAAGANTTVSIEWTPTCADYPVMPGFPAQSLPVTINVTADCNCTDCPTCPADGSNGKIAESNETNNLLSKFIPAIQVYSTYDVIGGVVNNGYKAKHFDCNTTEEPLYQFEYDEEMYGGVVYNVSGAKISAFSPGDTSTRTHHIDIPDGRTVKKARLYVYWYDKWGNYKTYPTGCLANLSVNFSGTEFMPEVKYNDQKGFGYYHSPKGTYAYDVTSKVTGSGDYMAIVENIDAKNSTTLLGEMLYVTYEDPTADNRIQFWTLEGNDYLTAADATHGSYNFGVSPEEATATVSFPGTVDLANVTSATLVTVVAQGMGAGSNMLFNGEVIKTDAWDAPTEAYSGSKVNVESVDVRSYLASSGNHMAFQDNGTDGMQACNAFLIINYEEEVEEEFFDTGYPENPYPSIFGMHNGTITPKYDIPVNRMYTYPCSGTGGHSEYIEIWNATGWTVNASWNGYKDDWHNISFDEPFILEASKTYYYAIRTGSYPQIHHTDTGELVVDGGTIRCTKFTDANGKVYYNWIPAIKLY